MEAWDGELASLESETDALLSRVRGAPSPARPRAGSRTPQPKRGRKKKRKGKRLARSFSGALPAPASPLAAPSPTAAGAATLPLPTDGERTTLEVLDARPASARSDTEEWDRVKAEAAQRAEAEKQRAAQRDQVAGQERAERELDFDAETANIDEGVLAFAPRADMSRVELTLQKEAIADKLAQARERAETLAQREAERDVRRELLDQELAAASLQRVYRGHLGRRRTDVARGSTAGSSAGASDWDFPATPGSGRHSEWKELRDEDQGLVWFYNEVTGHSQWERPDVDDPIGCVRLPALAHAARGMPGAEERGLPAEGDGDEDDDDRGSETGTDSETASVSTGLSLSGASTPRKLPPIKMPNDDGGGDDGDADSVTSSQQQQDERDEDISDDTTPRLFLGDGSANTTKLRDTVRHALTVSRFESVSTVLASNKKKQAPPAVPASSSRFNEPASKMFVSVMVGNGKRKGSSRRRSTAGKGKSPGKPRLDKLPSGTGTQQDDAPTLRDVTHDGFDLSESSAATGTGTEEVDDETNAAGETLQSIKDSNKRRVQEVCFSCWSAGQGKRCDMHATDTGKIVRSANSILMCKHWDLGVLRRRYRAEEIQEVFLKKNSSLKWHREMKQFVSVVEMRHPVYRVHSAMLEAENARMRRKLHVHAWFRSFLEEMRKDKVDKAAQSSTPALLRMRNTLANARYVGKFTAEVREQHPLAPVTGRSSLAPYVTDEIEEVEDGEGVIYHAPPVPVPVALYQPRQYRPFKNIETPLQDPKYRVPPPAPVPNAVMAEEHPASWFERFCAAEARDVLIRAQSQVLTVSPPPGADSDRRSKYPPPNTIKFSVFGQRARRKNLAVGGLPGEVQLYHIVTTVVAPQFGNFSVTDKRSVAPNVTPEVTVTIRGVIVNPFIQPYIHRPLEHPMNMRRAPTIMVSTIAREFETHFYGKNRPAQTGEEQPYGFRTTVSMTHFLVDDKIPTSVFVPTADVALPNQMAANRTVTTHVDRDYPFCEPTNRDNSTLDFYHLLLLGKGSANKAQIFTNLGQQDPGEFGMENDLTRPMGHNAAMVYRSWAFTQESEFEEFLTDDGVPYWYSHRTEETFWERPLHEIEKKPIIEGGTVIDSSAEVVTKGVGVSQDAPYAVGDMRSYIRSKTEAPDEKRQRAVKVNEAIQEAKASGVELQPRRASVAVQQDLQQQAPAQAQAQAQPKPGPAHLSAAYLPQERPGVVGGGGGAMGVASGASGVAHFQSNANRLAAQQEQPNMAHAELRPDSRGAMGQLGVPRAHIGVPDARPGLPGIDTASASRAIDVPATMYDQLSSRPTTGTTMRPDTRETFQTSSGMLTSRPGTAGTASSNDDYLPAHQAQQQGMSLLPGGQLPPHAQAIIQSIASAVSSAGAQGLQATDLLQLGVGLGLGLQGQLGSPVGVGSPQHFAQQAMQPGQQQQQQRPPGTADSQKSALRGPNSRSRGMSVTMKLPDEEAHGLPIGAAQPQPPPDRPELLPTVVEPQPPLDSRQQFQGIHVVQATPTPDEVENPVTGVSSSEDSQQSAASAAPPVVVGAVGQEFVTHPPAGLGTSFLPADGGEGGGDAKDVDGENGHLRRAGDVLPTGFIQTVTLPHKGRMYVDYLPHEPNVNVARAVGVAKPRTASEDWLAIGYDPWSAGKEPLTIEFVSNLAANADRMVQGSATAGAGADATSGVQFVDAIDSAAAEREAQQKRQAELVEKLFSWCRHGKFHELEQALSDPTIDYDIDAKNEVGNTLLLIAVQNNNKRIVKLCLRRGADISCQNLNGNSVLHYAYAFGFNELAEYLLAKGADSTLVNADNLTPYEGLSAADLQAL